ncbi:Bacterial extracellular solute-binding protein [uncultured archaeon]|nr:Bacterial extracellular solute-binding protein [uncultured archaeon]
MRISRIIVLAAIGLAIFLAGCSQQGSGQQTSGQQANTRLPELVVYTYDSMVSEYGLGPKVIPAFEAKCNCKVKTVAKGDAGQVLSILKLEKQNPRADLVIGIDNSLSSKAIESGVLEKFAPKNISIVPEELRFDNEGYLTPYDYGFVAFVYDSKKVDVNLSGFDSLLDKRLEKKVLIQNPRTSSPGLALLLWTVAVYGDPGYREFWKKFKPSVLTVTASWDESAGLFSKGEAPVYLSYATSPPYYVQFEDNNHFLAAGFSEGHYMQVEGMGIVKGAKNRKLAEEFIEFSLTDEFQEEIPLTQFMFPVNQSVKLPKSFEYALMPVKKLSLDPELVGEKQEEWISEWEKIMSSG